MPKHRTAPGIPLGPIKDTAHHEAGHAVAAVAFVGTVHQVSIVPDAAAAGRCATRSFGMLGRPDYLAEQMAIARERGDTCMAAMWHSRLLGHAVYSFAGYCAEFMFTRCRVHVAGLFAEEVWDGWHFIELAGYGPDEDVVMREERRTRSFLRRHWQHVTAVASALLEHRTLNEEKFNEVIDRVGPIRPYPLPHPPPPASRRRR